MTKTIEQIEAVTSHKPDTERRVLRRCEIGKAIHQGDVYLHRVADDHPRGKPWGSRQVAIGTQVGSRHVVVGDGVEVFAGVESACKKLLPKFTDEQRRACTGPVVVATAPFVLEHPEHAHHALPAGTYQVSYQWDEATMARVAD